MFSSAQLLHTNVWLEEWRRFMLSDPTDVPSGLRSRLIDPLKAP